MARRSRTLTPSSTMRRSTSASSARLTGLGIIWRTSAGAICSSWSSSCCVSAMPMKSAARARKSATRRRLHLARRPRHRWVVGEPRAPWREFRRARATTWRAARASCARDAGGGRGTPSSAKIARADAGPMPKTPRRATSPPRISSSSRGARSALTSMDQGTTTGTNRGPRRVRGDLSAAGARWPRAALRGGSVGRACAAAEQGGAPEKQEGHRGKPGDRAQPQHENAGHLQRLGGARESGSPARVPRERSGSSLATRVTSMPRRWRGRARGFCETSPSPIVSRP